MHYFRNGLSHPPGWDNISLDVKISGYSCLKSANNRTLQHFEGGTRESNPSVEDLQSTTRHTESWMLQILDTRIGFPSRSLNVVIDYFSHSCLKLCKICLKRTLDATFLYCLALTFCDVIDELLPEWACLSLQGGITFLLT